MSSGLIVTIGQSAVLLEADALRRSLGLALVALMVAPAARPGAPTHASWRWERTIVPNAASPSSEQCAVLDADVFARAAPGLRDARLVQDGRELAYAIDESVDEHADSRLSAEDDRSVYDTVVTASFMDAGPRSSKPTLAPAPDKSAMTLVPAHVPVERLRLDIEDNGGPQPALPPAMHVTLTARPSAAGQALEEAELVELLAAPQHLLLPVTLGANLQDSATVTVRVDPAPASLAHAVLEMRRREICYQPLSSSPVTLFFGNPGAPPVHYEFGRFFQPKATPLLSSMGAIQRNPAFHQTNALHVGISKRAKLLIAILTCALALLLTVRLLLHKH